MRPIYCLLLIAAFSPCALAQSFDCKLAKSPREHAVCSDKKLASLDDGVSAAYKSLRAQLSPASAALVQSDQRGWLHWLGLVCPANGKGFAEDIDRCLENQYSLRESDLKQVVRIGQTLVFARSYFTYKTGSSIEEPVPTSDPGFGWGSLRWPQIDLQPASSDPAYAEWNRAVKKAAERAAGIDPKNNNAAFENGGDDSVTIDAFYKVEAANERFIAVRLIDSSYGWGAAHPLTDQTSFLWWLHRNRQLIASDVFLPQSGWQDKLTTLAVSNLRSQPDLEDMLGDDIDKTVKETVSNPANWTPTRDGLTISFGQYAVGPYAIGMPEAQIPWSEMRPYLARDFQPAMLPAASKPAP